MPAAELYCVILIQSFHNGSAGLITVVGSYFSAAKGTITPMNCFKAMRPLRGNNEPSEDKSTRMNPRCQHTQSYLNKGESTSSNSRVEDTSDVMVIALNTYHQLMV